MYVDGSGSDGAGNPQVIGNQIAQIGAGIEGFAAGAASGDVAVSAEGGQALIEALNHMEEGLKEALYDTYQITQEPSIGDTPVAQALKPFVAETADGQPFSFLPNIQKFMDETIPKAREAIQQAMRNYQQVDADNAQNLNQQC